LQTSKANTEQEKVLQTGKANTEQEKVLQTGNRVDCKIVAESVPAIGEGEEWRICSM